MNRVPEQVSAYGRRKPSAVWRWRWNGTGGGIAPPASTSISARMKRVQEHIPSVSITQQIRKVPVSTEMARWLIVRLNPRSNCSNLTISNPFQIPQRLSDTCIKALAREHNFLAL